MILWTQFSPKMTKNDRYLFEVNVVKKSKYLQYRLIFNSTFQIFFFWKILKQCNNQTAFSHQIDNKSRLTSEKSKLAPKIKLSKKYFRKVKTGSEKLAKLAPKIKLSKKYFFEKYLFQSKSNVDNYLIFAFNFILLVFSTNKKKNIKIDNEIYFYIYIYLLHSIYAQNLTK